jgi:hypothetical protein
LAAEFSDLVVAPPPVLLRPADQEAPAPAAPSR